MASAINTRLKPSQNILNRQSVNCTIIASRNNKFNAVYQKRLRVTVTIELSLLQVKYQKIPTSSIKINFSRFIIKVISQFSSHCPMQLAYVQQQTGISLSDYEQVRLQR